MLRFESGALGVLGWGTYGGPGQFSERIEILSDKGRGVIITNGSVVTFYDEKVGQNWTHNWNPISPMAEPLGFQTINPAMVISVVDEIVKRLGGHPEVAFECVGSAAPLNTCIRSVVRGGDVVVIGVYEEPPTTDMILVQDKEINMLGSLMYTWDDFHATVDIIAQKQVALEPLRTHYLPFEAWLEGYNLLINSPNEAMKVMLNLI